MPSFIQPACPSRSENRLCPAGVCRSCDRARLMLRRVSPATARRCIDTYAVFYVDAEGVIWFTTPREHKWACAYYSLPPSRRYWVTEGALAVGLPEVRQMEMVL